MKGELCKGTLLFTFAGFFVSISFSQIAIKGTVTDSIGKPIQQANVLLVKNVDSSLVKGTITDNKGQFLLEKVREGKYLLSYSFSGYKQLFSEPFTVSNSSRNVDVKNISLSRDPLQLKKVTVTVKKQLFEQKIDRMVINVAGSITSAGSTALDVLERSPGVIVDRNNNGLSINGKTGVVVMINGKINYMPLNAVVQMLAGMSADNIEKIEIITTPPANLDAEGNAGYINILLKSNPNYGTNGSFSLSAGYGNKDNSSADININHRKGKLNLYGNYSFTRIHQLQVFSFYRKVINGSKTIETSSTSNRDPVRYVHNVRFGIDYQLSKKTIVGGIFAGYNNRWTMDAMNDVSVVVNNKTDTLLRIDNSEINQWTNLMGNINVQRTLKGDSKITADLDYVYYKDNNPTNYLNSYFNGSGNFLYNENTKSTKITPIHIGAAKVDYTGKIGKKVDVETGAKFSISEFTNDVGVAKMEQDNWKYDDTLTARYKLKENISAAYASVNIAVNDKTSIKGGLRYEYTTSNLGTATVKNIVDRKYGRLFPTLYFSRKINDKHSFNLAYNRRITRPSFNDLAPFVIFVDPNTFISGNPALQPSTSDVVKADYMYKSYIFSISYTYEKEPIASFQTKVNPKNNKQYISAENLINTKTISLNLTLPITCTKWWSMQNNISGQWQKIRGTYDNSLLEVEQKSAEIFSQQNFTFPKGFSSELSGFYTTGGLFGRAIYKSVYSVNFGLQKKLGDKAGTLRFGIDNVFNSLKFRSYQDFPQHNLVSRLNLQFNNRLFKLTYTKKFGNNVLKSQRERGTGSEEERKRVQ
ncbi:TonB-dependent receptor [Segetibacter koreensis]|uniref:TonB-dependent receptor n=1 Tax=Segetibacter koreensis TaxID=398037 RepID=UPI00037AFF32|nr:TonB-dependent receptor [Segetibacter koreensis]